MKLIFICASLQQGRDGVGDYSRRLAGELIRNGHQIYIIAVNDRYIENIIEEIQLDGVTKISTLRLAEKITWKEKIIYTRRCIDSFRPDWVSLQYVPHAYQRKGMPFQLIYFLRKINSNRFYWHFMLHELWVGELKSDGFKLQIIKFFEQYILKKIILFLNPKKIHVSNNLYQSFLLFRLNVHADVLSVFSNFILRENNNMDFQSSNNIDINFIKENRAKYFLVTNFGSYYYKWWDISNAISALLIMAEKEGKELVLISLGKISNQEQVIWSQNNCVKNIVLGEESADNITTWLTKFTDIGIVTTPYLLLNKSGSFQVFKQHGVPVVVLYKRWLYRVPIKMENNEADYLFDEINNKIILNSCKIEINSSLYSIANFFINDLMKVNG